MLTEVHRFVAKMSVIVPATVQAAAGRPAMESMNKTALFAAHYFCLSAGHHIKNDFWLIYC